MNPALMDMIVFATNREVRPLSSRRYSASTWAPVHDEWTIIRTHGRTMRQAKRRLLVLRQRYVSGVQQGL